MRARVPRNFAPTLKPQHKALLRRIEKLRKAHPYPPNVCDMAHTPRERNRLMQQLYKLEREDWIEIYRDDRGRIRGLAARMLP